MSAATVVRLFFESLWDLKIFLFCCLIVLAASSRYGKLGKFS